MISIDVVLSVRDALSAAFTRDPPSRARPTQPAEMDQLREWEETLAEQVAMATKKVRVAYDVSDEDRDVRGAPADLASHSEPRERPRFTERVFGASLLGQNGMLAEWQRQLQLDDDRQMHTCTALREPPAPAPTPRMTAAETEVVEDLSREDEGTEHEPASVAAVGGTRSEPTSATAAAAGARSEPERAADGGVALGTELMVSRPGVGLVRGVVIAYHTGSVDLWRVQLHPHTPGRARGSAATPSTTAAKAQARGSAPSVHYLTRADVERGLADAASAGASRRDEAASDDSDQADDDSLTDNEEDELLLLPRCPKSHKLQAEVVVASCVCDRCACTAAAGARVLSCRLCDWDLCDRCYSGPTERAAT